MPDCFFDHCIIKFIALLVLLFIFYFLFYQKEYFSSKKIYWYHTFSHKLCFLKYLNAFVLSYYINNCFLQTFHKGYITETFYQTEFAFYYFSYLIFLQGFIFTQLKILCPVNQNHSSLNYWNKRTMNHFNMNPNTVLQSLIILLLLIQLPIFLLTVSLTADPFIATILFLWIISPSATISLTTVPSNSFCWHAFILVMLVFYLIYLFFFSFSSKCYIATFQIKVLGTMVIKCRDNFRIFSFALAIPQLKSWTQQKTVYYINNGFHITWYFAKGYDLFF